MTTRAILSTTLAATILSLASAALPGVEPEFRELAANDAARAPAEALASSLHPGFTTEKVCQRRGAETSIGIVHVEMHGPGATTGTSLMVKVVDGKGTLLQELPAYKGMTFDPKDAGKAQRIIDCYEACAAFSPGKGMPVLQKLVSVTMGGLSQVAIGGEAAGSSTSTPWTSSPSTPTTSTGTTTSLRTWPIPTRSASSGSGSGCSSTDAGPPGSGSVQERSKSSRGRRPVVPRYRVQQFTS